MQETVNRGWKKSRRLTGEPPCVWRLFLGFPDDCNCNLVENFQDFLFREIVFVYVPDAKPELVEEAQVRAAGVVHSNCVLSVGSGQGVARCNIDRIPFFTGQLHVGGCGEVAEVGGVHGAGNGLEVCGMAQQPGDCGCGRGKVMGEGVLA